ncbi:enoyl-ACP reductase FabV [Photobacterium sp. DNB22_13_2]
MIIEPVIKGVVARSAHPYGCQQAVRKQIDYVKQAKPIVQGAKRVLILGASSGFGLASRIAHTFGGAEADTVGVSFERGPSDKGVGSAGWYNNIFFKQEAENAGRVATNIVGDAFSEQVRQQVIESISNDLGGQVDLVVYSLATGVRPNPDTGDMWRSVIKTTGKPVVGPTLDLETDSLAEMTVETASREEIADTVKVMGGEDWASWIQCLSDAGVMAQGCRTVAYSYIGPEVTYPIYHHGTLGRAKEHMHNTAEGLNTQLAVIGGQAHVAVCKALVTKASVFIPAFTPYILALFKVMKEKGTHEGCIEQMQRLFSARFYTQKDSQQCVLTDEQRLIRMDDWELAPDVQQKVNELMAEMNTDNFAELGDYAGYKQDFMELNGFGLAGVDYQQDIVLDSLKALQP